MRFPSYRKWDIVWCSFPKALQAENTPFHILMGRHPAIVISHNHACNNSNTILVIPGTHNLKGKERYIGQVCIPANKELGIPVETRFDCGRIMTIDVAWIDYCTGTLLNTPYMEQFNDALCAAFELEIQKPKELSFKARKKLFVFCPHCGARFTADADCEEIVCKCCNHTLTFPKRENYAVTCPACGADWRGETNADPEKNYVSRCKCGAYIKLAYDVQKQQFVANGLST